MPETIIHTKKLTKTYCGVHALTNLDLKIPAHSIVGFLGPNGAGKSTTIKLLLGLIQPTSGSGEIFGKDIVSDSRQIRQRVGYLAQQPKFDDRMTARETLRFVAKFFYREPAGKIERRVEESLILVGLQDKANRPVKHFSGGEIQRLGIAQAQINEPELLILDEPAAALDPMGRRDVLNIMENLREKTTIFYSTHILDDVQRISDHVVILNQGTLVAHGPIETLLNAKDGAVYHIKLQGNVEAAKARIVQQPWVSDLYVSRVNGTTNWRIGINNTEKADSDLLRILLTDASVRVLEYRPESYELEDVFMQMMEV